MRKRILVVDDDPDLREILRDRLQAWGFDVSEAANGSEGLTALERSRFDVVLLDVSMPVMDGLTMLKHLRIRHDHLPVIMVSVPEDRKTLLQAAIEGAQDYVVKPIDLSQLETKCIRAVYD